jgi:hypothetical protein
MKKQKQNQKTCCFIRHMAQACDVILAFWEVEIRSFTGQGQPWQEVCETAS